MSSQSASEHKLPFLGLDEWTPERLAEKERRYGDCPEWFFMACWFDPDWQTNEQKREAALVALSKG